MKNFYSAILLQVVLLPLLSNAQLTNGGTNAYFGIDGDTRSNYVKYGTSSGNIASDDWFSSSPFSFNVIDTSNATNLFNLLQGGANIGFNKRMSVPLFSKINGRLWLDAVYGRDYVATSSLFDSTAFTIASKNGDNPSNWAGGSTGIFPIKLTCWMYMRICAGMDLIYMIPYGFLRGFPPSEPRDPGILMLNYTKIISVTTDWPVHFPPLEPTRVIHNGCSMQVETLHKPVI